MPEVAAQMYSVELLALDHTEPSDHAEVSTAGQPVDLDMVGPALMNLRGLCDLSM